MTDEQYLRAIVEEDCYASFEALMVRYRKQVFAICMRQLHNAADAEDATQEVFRKLLVSSAEVHGNLGGWLRRCAVNTSISMIRTANARRKREARAVTRGGQNNHSIDKIDHAELVAKLLRELQPHQREMLVRHVLEGVTQTTLAQEQGITQQAVAARFDKIRKQLTSWMRERHLLAWGLGLILSGWWSAAKASTARCLSYVTGSVSGGGSASGAAAGTAGTYAGISASKGVAVTAVALSVACMLPGDDPAHSSHPKSRTYSTSQVNAASLATRSRTTPTTTTASFALADNTYAPFITTLSTEKSKPLPRDEPWMNTAAPYEQARLADVTPAYDSFQTIVTGRTPSTPGTQAQIGTINSLESFPPEGLRSSSRLWETSITARRNGRRDRATPLDVPNETPHRFARRDTGTDWPPEHALNPSAQKEDAPDTVSHPRGSVWESFRPWPHDDRDETFRPHSRFVRHNETFEDETSRPFASQRYRIAEAFREVGLTPDDEPPRSVETFVKLKERFREKEPRRDDRIEHTLAMIGSPPFQALTRLTDTSPANEAAQANAQALFDVPPHVLSTDEPSQYALTALQLAEFDQPHLIPSESTDLFTSTARSQPIIAFEKLAADRITSISLPEPTSVILLGAGSLALLRRQSHPR